MPSPLEPSEFARIGDAYRYTWPTTGIQVELHRFTESKEGLHAEVTIARLIGANARLLHDARLNLLSTTTKAALVRSLEKQAGEGIDWTNVVEHFCFRAKQAYREGEPAIDLMTIEGDPRPRWLLKPYMEHSGPTVLFGPGGTGKTYFADAAAVSLATGKAIVGYPVGEPVRVLILDYEADKYTHLDRLLAVQRGHDVPDNLNGRVFYRHMTVPLHAAAAGLRREVAEKGIGAVIVDSLSMACGGELEAAAEILRCFAALRSLEAPALLISHVTKAQVKGAEEGGGMRRLSPFGSIYTENQARNTWSITRAGEEGGDAGHVALIHEKTNNGRYQKRHAYSVEFTPDPDDEDDVLAVEYRRAEMGDVAAFADRVPLTERVLRTLTSGQRTMGQLREALPDVEAGTLRATVNNLKKQRRVIPFPGDAYGLSSDREQVG